MMTMAGNSFLMAFFKYGKDGEKRRQKYQVISTQHKNMNKLHITHRSSGDSRSQLVNPHEWFSKSLSWRGFLGKQKHCL